MSDEFEIRADGVRARKDRWEVGIRRIVALLWGNRHAFEVDEVVEAVRVLIPEPKLDDEGLVQAVLGMPATQPISDARLDELRQANGGALNFVTLREFRAVARAVEQELASRCAPPET